MSFLSRLSLSLILAGGSLAAHAAVPTTPTPDDAAARASAIAEFESARTHALAAKVAGTNTRPGTPKANPLRAYPPSCAASPLPDKPSGPTVTKRMQLWKTNYAGSVNLREDVTISIWRLPCSSSGAVTRYNPDGAANAITLMRIDRDAANEGVDLAFPTMPYVQASQNGSDMNDYKSLVRTPLEPNTLVSESPFNTPLIKSTTFVLENYALQNVRYFTFSDAFKLRINPVLGVSALVDLDVPAYVPNAQDYPSAFEPREIDGYAAAQWINGELNEGLLVQVTEATGPNDALQRQVVFDLLTEDTNGDPLWLVGNAAFPVNARSLEIELGYLVNGLQLQPWGTATIEIADCNHLDVTYAANDDLAEPIPVFNGLTTYERLFTANGMTCE